MRGKPTHTRRDRKGERITPAGAGKTSTNAAGKIVVGITPAGAGKTRTATASLFAETDHPRRCGENCQEFIHFCIFIGSPPQVRGKPGGGSGPGDTIGDHPRRCGENFFFVFLLLPIPGSPPQVRGKHRSNAQKAVKYRITPAGAGKTMLYIIAQILYKDHPRRCGENKSHGRERSARVGSPPQVRGKLWATAPVAACMRITPAGAGKTSATSFAIRGTWDHPRRCGENKCDLMIYSKKSGSPPRMRGKQGREAAKKLPGRITPADAGKTIFESRQAAAE